jgi:outer membrane protein assembly factor BamB
MKSNRRLRVWVSALGTMAVFGLVVGLVALRGPGGPTVEAKDEDKEAPPAKKGARQWPLWGGTIQRNLVNLDERNIPIDWSTKKGAEKNIKWSVALGSKAYGGPIIAGGKIFVGTNNNVPRNKAVRGDKGILMCFNQATGEFLWQAIHDKLPIGRVQDWPDEGICSSPVVEGDRLWYVNNRCEVICASTGGLAAGNRGVKDEQYKSKIDADIIWRLDMIKDLDVFPHNLATCSPLIVGDTLFVITSNGVDEGHINIPSPKAPSFLAINKNSGKVIWQSSAPGTSIMHGQWSNPVYTVTNGTPQVIFPGGDGYLYAFNPANGNLLWKFDCNPKGSKYVLGGKGTKSDFVCTPVVWENKLYIGVGQDPEHKKGIGHLWCIDLVKALAKGASNANKDVSPFSPPKGDDPPFDPKDKRNSNSAMLWHYGGRAPANAARDYIFGRTLSTCAVHDGLCYAAEYDGVLHCLDATTGKMLWDYELNGDTWSSPYWVDGKVYIGNERGEIHIFKHGKKLQLLKKIAMGGVQTKVRATPVALDGVMYVITENPCRLWAITNK